MNRIAAVVAGLLLAFVGTSATIADTINVPGDYALIQDAIDASVNGDVINIAAGTYNEHSLNTSGKAITIQGTLNGDGSLATTIDAQQGGRVFRIDSGESNGTEIRDLVITGGTDSGICCLNSNPTITGCTISNNQSMTGGGIFCQNGSPTITNCEIVGNTGTVNGGGIICYSNSSPTITGCTISGNTAKSFGGGIWCFAASLNISGCTISGNTAGYGGGIYCQQSSMTISNCAISDNTGSEAGGIEIEGDENNVTISNSKVCGNQSPQTSGSYSASESCITNNCLLCPGNPFPPPTPAGACCVSSGCESLSSDQCTAMGGNWLGEDGSCDDCPASCSGDTNNDGVINIEDLLNMLANFGSVCP